MKKTAILLNSDSIGHIDEQDVICADGGYRYSSGKNVIAVVGDFDSLKDIPDNVTAKVFPPEKNMTDGEIAVRYAALNSYSDIVIYGASGGRLDHVLGNISLLELADSLGIRAVIKTEDFLLYYSRDNVALKTAVGDIISVFAYGGDAVVKEQTGMHYPMDMLELKSFSTRGISNIAVDKQAIIRVARGGIIVFHYRQKK